jgi:hypothetical protein
MTGSLRQPFLADLIVEVTFSTVPKGEHSNILVDKTKGWLYNLPLKRDEALNDMNI